MSWKRFKDGFNKMGRWLKKAAVDTGRAVWKQATIAEKKAEQAVSTVYQDTMKVVNRAEDNVAVLSQGVGKGLSSPLTYVGLGLAAVVGISLLRK